MFAGLISIVIEILFWGIFISAIVRAVKRGKKRQDGGCNGDRTRQTNSGQAQQSYGGQLRQMADSAVGHTQEQLKKRLEQNRSEWQRRSGSIAGMPAAGRTAGVGERFLEGDMVPKDKQRVVCGYCGAENLLPRNAGRKYTCYFCREFLS